jgi:transcriptional regulator with XRE-family HTH domain
VKEVKKEYYIAFGENLKVLLKKHHKDVATVAALGNIESKQVYRVLKGEHAASLGTIIAIAKGLGVHPKELFDFPFPLDLDIE